MSENSSAFSRCEAGLHDFASIVLVWEASGLIKGTISLERPGLGMSA